MKNLTKVQDKRLADLFAVAGIGAFGSLYFVPEEIWKRAHGTRYDQKSTRKGHPGCSVRRFSTSLDAVPLLHGSSSKARSYCIAVTGIFEKGSCSWFGGLPPVPVSPECWQLARDQRIRSAPSGKYRVTPKEEQKLSKLCRNKGWIKV